MLFTTAELPVQHVGQTPTNGFKRPSVETGRTVFHVAFFRTQVTDQALP